VSKRKHVPLEGRNEARRRPPGTSPRRRYQASVIFIVSGVFPAAPDGAYKWISRSVIPFVEIDVERRERKGRYYVHIVHWRRNGKV
jgi:hypothetical protein